jgi:hypothetical protein
MEHGGSVATHHFADMAQQGSSFANRLVRVPNLASHLLGQAVRRIAANTHQGQSV